MNFTSNEKKELLDISKMMKERYKRISNLLSPSSPIKLGPFIYNEKLNLYDSIIRKLEE
jgi:hypothetical protein